MKATLENKCPHGYEFGKDCESGVECEFCNKWEYCVQSFENGK